MSKLKLVYFDKKGTAETSRLILKISGIKFEDIRYAIDFDKENKSSDFERDKKLGLFDKSLGNLPFLEIINNGSVEILSQPSSIERYLAKKYDLMGKTLLEEAKIDSVCEYISCIREHYNNITHYQKLKTDTEHVKKELENLVKILECDNIPYAIGNKLSLADIRIYTLITVDFNDHKDIIYPIAGRIKKIRNIVVRVSNIPEVREWTKMYPV